MRHYNFCKKLMSFSVLPALVMMFGFVESAHAISIIARVSDQSTEVINGDRLYFEVEIKYPENPVRKDLRLEYQILEDEKVVASEKVLRAVETQASFLDYIVVPKSTNGGLHILNVIVTNYDGTLNQSVSATFKVLHGLDQVTTYFFIMLGAISLVALLVIFQIIFSRRRRVV